MEHSAVGRCWELILLYIATNCGTKNCFYTNIILFFMIIMCEIIKSIRNNGACRVLNCVGFQPVAGSLITFQEAIFLSNNFVDVS